MSRTIPGGVVHCQLAKADGTKTDWPTPTVWGLGNKSYEFVGGGMVTVTPRGVAVYEPLPEEYEPYDLVTFTFDGTGLLPQSMHINPTEPPYSPPAWNGDPSISKARFLELVALSTPPRTSEFFLTSLLGFDVIPLTPAILQGLHKAYPTIF